MSVGQSKNIRARQGKFERWMRREKKRAENWQVRLEQRRKAKLRLADSPAVRASE